MIYLRCIYAFVNLSLSQVLYIQFKLNDQYYHYLLSINHIDLNLKKILLKILSLKLNYNNIL